MSDSSRWRRQLKDGEQLYVSHLPGKRSLIAWANSRALAEIGRRRLEPEHVGVRRVRASGRSRRRGLADAEEALGGSLARDERRACSSTSLVRSEAESESVRATRTVGTSSTSQPAAPQRGCG